MLVYYIGLTTPIVKLLDSLWPGGGVTLMLPFSGKIVFGKQENLMLSSSNACPKQILLTPEKKKHISLNIYLISKVILKFDILSSFNLKEKL